MTACSDNYCLAQDSSWNAIQDIGNMCSLAINRNLFLNAHSLYRRLDRERTFQRTSIADRYR